MLDYFKLYGLKPAFHLQYDELRKSYLNIQREWHPDFFVNDEKKYSEALAKTALNNEAFKALKEFSSVVGYVLREYNLLQEGEKNILPPAFLADMLDLNDLIGEAALGDEGTREKADETLSNYEQENLSEMKALTNQLDAQESWTEESLYPLKVLYQQHRYLGRLRKILNGTREL